VEIEPTRMCELMIGLPAINVLGIDDERDGSVVVHVESCARRPGCPCCGTPAWVKDRPAVELVDLACFGRAARLVWHNRWRCPAGDCEMGSWTGEDPRIAPTRGAMTDRAGPWVCEQVGRLGRTVAEGVDRLVSLLRPVAAVIGTALLAAGCSDNGIDAIVRSGAGPSGQRTPSW
jgi:hypothetical protein